MGGVVSNLVAKCPAFRVLNLAPTFSVKITFWGKRTVSYMGKELGSFQSVFTQYFQNAGAQPFQDLSEREEVVSVGQMLRVLHGESIEQLEHARSITKIMFMLRELIFGHFLDHFNAKDADWGFKKAVNAINEKIDTMLERIARYPISILGRKRREESRLRFQGDE